MQAAAARKDAAAQKHAAEQDEEEEDSEEDEEDEEETDGELARCRCCFVRPFLYGKAGTACRLSKEQAQVASYLKRHLLLLCQRWGTDSGQLAPVRQQVIEPPLEEEEGTADKCA